MIRRRLWSTLSRPCVQKCGGSGPSTTEKKRTRCSGDMKKTEHQIPKLVQVLAVLAVIRTDKTVERNRRHQERESHLMFLRNLSKSLVFLLPELICRALAEVLALGDIQEHLDRPEAHGAEVIDAVLLARGCHEVLGFRLLRKDQANDLLVRRHSPHNYSICANYDSGPLLLCPFLTFPCVKSQKNSRLGP